MPYDDAPAHSVLAEPDPIRRAERFRQLTRESGAREFLKLRAGMIHAMDGGLWLHRHVWMGRPMVHLVSTDKQRLLDYGTAVGIPASRLQFKPLKDPRNDIRRDAWHWDLGGPALPPVDEMLRMGTPDTQSATPTVQSLPPLGEANPLPPATRVAIVDCDEI
jgi:hypothetical protein